MKKVLLYLLLVIIGVIALAGCEADGEDNNSEKEADQNMASREVLPAEEQGVYPDGRYRGAFHDRGMQQVGIQFHLEENQLYDISFRVLAHGGNNYLEPLDENNAWPAEDLEILAEQHQQLIEYLEGRDITEIADLYNPEVAADDAEGSGEIIDTWTGATLRGSKIISSIRDGLNRGVY